MITTLESRLSIGYQVVCDPDYYGKDCATNCSSDALTGHYTCDLDSGKVVCRPGK